MKSSYALEEAVSVGPRGLVLRLHPAPIKPRFSICILVTNWPQFDRCIASYCKHGFDPTCSEILLIDNTSGNRADAYVGLNEFLQAAEGQYVILSHQDVSLIDHDRIRLEKCLEELTLIDPHWGLCGNAGYTRSNKPVLFLSHPVSDNHVSGGPFPAAVISLDENFIIARKLANLSLSRDLEGFHHYGADLCTVADILGWTAYVVAFKLRHDSGGTVDEVYARSGKAITRKYARALRPRWINLVTERPFYVSGSGIKATQARATRALGNGLSRARWLAGTARAWLRSKTGSEGRIIE